MIIGLNCTEAVELAQADRAALFAKIKGIGITEVRVEFPWKIINSEPKLYDGVIADASTAGLNLLVMVAHPPSPTPPASSFQTGMQTLATKYPQVGYWEVWNEENAQVFWPKGNPKTFTPYLQAGYAGVKAGNPQAKVVLGGLAACATHSGIAFGPKFPFIAAYTNTDPVAFLTGVYAAGGGGHFDILASHPYSWDAGFRPLSFSPANPYIAALPELRSLMNSKGDGAKELWGTEYGYAVTSTATAGQQAANLAAQTTWMASAPASVDRAYVMCARDFATTTYGIWDKNNNPRPAVDWLTSLPKS